MKKHLLAALFCPLLFGSAFVLLYPQAGFAQTQPTADYDAVRDFSITSNPSGVWTYGWESSLGAPLNLYTVTDSSTFPGLSAWLETDMTMYAPPFVGHNDTDTTVCFMAFCVPPGYLHVHPGANNELSVVRWTAPTSGTFFLQGSVRGLDLFTTTNFLAILNSEQHLFGATVSNRNPPVFFHRTLTLVAGDTVDFLVNFGQNRTYFNDSTGIQFKVTQMQ
jgi:hypothetical protein